MAKDNVIGDIFVRSCLVDTDWYTGSHTHIDVMVMVRKMTNMSIERKKTLFGYASQSPTEPVTCLENYQSHILFGNKYSVLFSLCLMSNILATPD